MCYVCMYVPPITSKSVWIHLFPSLLDLIEYEFNSFFKEKKFRKRKAKQIEFNLKSIKPNIFIIVYKNKYTVKLGTIAQCETDK